MKLKYLYHRGDYQSPAHNQKGGVVLLPDIILNDENFEEIFEEARGMVASLYPDWTDHNYHDPGITMLELFAWLKEIQLYKLNFLTDEMRIKFLNLAGMRRQHKTPSYAAVSAMAARDASIAAGTKLYAYDICFETCTSQMLTENDIAQVFAYKDDVLAYADRSQLRLGSGLSMHMFGEKSDGDFYIAFDKSLPSGVTLYIYFSIGNDNAVKRNPADDGFIPFGSFAYEYYTKDGWKPLPVTKDETERFAQSGFISFSVPEPMEKANITGDEKYYIRIRIIDYEFDIPTVLKDISMNMLQLEQADTICEYRAYKHGGGNEIKLELDTYLGYYGESTIYLEHGGLYTEVSEYELKTDDEKRTKRIVIKKPEGMAVENVIAVSFPPDFLPQTVLGIGNGFPEQIFSLDDPDVMYDRFDIIVWDIESGAGFCKWEKVQDFCASKPSDKHYILNPESGEVRFGDSMRGMAPEGEIRIVQYAKCRGASGNVKSGKIKQTADHSLSDVLFTNNENAHGGKDEQSLEHCFQCARLRLNEPECLLTYADYERAVLNTPGLLIESCKVVPPNKLPHYKQSEAHMICAVVKPFSFEKNPRLSRSYQKNILAHLDKNRIVGTKIQLLSPEYIKLTMFLEIVIKAHYANDKTIVNDAVSDYLKPFEAEFGKTVLYYEIYGVIDRLQCVVSINSLSIDAKGSGVLRSPEGDLTLPPNGILSEKEININYILEE